VKTVYLSLGSNVGDREAHLREAIERLEAADIRILRCSAIFETEPQDVKEQGWFLNAVVEVETELFPMQLLARAQKIERDLGRQRLKQGGPRTIDIDILLYGSVVIRTPQLEIPHPRMTARRFVLEPLAQLAPDLVHPVTGQAVSAMLAQIQGQPVLQTRLTL
jgi:2-amino-4-hydroxy-6-hydroxymethyldihydropteridine diphosphokinase